MAGKRLKEYFTFTKRERNGIIVLLSLLLIFIIADNFINFSSNEEIILMDDDFKDQIDQFENSLTKKTSDKKTHEYKNDSNTSDDKNNWFIPDSLFNFDPNTASKKELQKLGLSKNQINTLLKYRAAGGQFYNNQDLLKVYGIEQKQYNQLKTHILIADQNDHSSFKKDKKDGYWENEDIELTIEINSSTKDSLMIINGIGPNFAERIIKYRDLLGGFVSRQQLHEVYGLDSSLINKIRDQIIIDSSLIRKININKVDYSDLIRHPYINKYQTQSLLKYRELQGKFNSIDEINEHNLLPNDTFQKIKPYLKN
ncbi:MAG: helix-hairpin-helix domain-containing protein [Bacteroidales bacterium]